MLGISIKTFHQRGKGCPKSITWEPEESTELVCLLVAGKLDGGVGKNLGEELKFAGGRTELGICGDICGDKGD